MFICSMGITYLSFSIIRVTLSGPYNVSCLLGNWTTLPTCKLTYCDKPNLVDHQRPLQNSTFYVRSFVFVNATVRFSYNTCNPFVSTVNHNKYCVFLCNVNLQVNTTYRSTCERGYEGNITVYCNETGKWEYDGNCTLVNCPEPDYVPLSNRSHSSNKFYWNDTIVFR